MTSQNNRQTTSNSNLLIALSITIISVSLCIALIITTGSFSQIALSVRNILPRFATYSPALELTTLDEAAIIKSQPKISYKDNNKYVLIEVNGIDCADCYKIYSSNNSDYKRFLSNYVKNGKLDYVWLDYQEGSDIKKHEALYCAGEQDPKKFFSMKEAVFEKQSQTLQTIDFKNLANSQKLDTKKFEGCLNADKYKNRIENLSSFAKNNMKLSSIPSFYLYELSTISLTEISGKKTTTTQATLLTSFQLDINYEVTFKSKLDKYLK